MQFLAEMWRFLKGQPTHPIYRHELAGWSYLPIWSRLRRGCLPLMVVLLVSAVGCCGLTPLLTAASDDEWPLAVFSALVGVLIAGEIVRWLVGLLATAVTSTALSSEVEAETYGLLRITPVPPREVVLAKFGAAFRQFRLPLAAIAAARLLFVVGAVVYVIVLLSTEVAGSVSGTLPSVPQIVLPFGPLVASYIVAGIAALVALLMLLLYFLIEPASTTLIYAAVGMLASAWARTRSGGLMTAIGFRAALMGISYILSQVIGVAFSLLALPLMALPASPIWLERVTMLEPSIVILLVAAGTMVWLAIVLAGQIGLAALMLHAAVRRAERLPYTT